MSKFVHCPSKDLVFLPNATTGISTIVRNMISKDDTVYSLNLTYGAVKKLLKHVCEEVNAHLQQEEIKFPTTHEDILKVVKATLKENTKLAVFDHIPSNYGIVLPVKQLVELCHSKNIPVLIDGAHALGNLDLNIEDIGADFYVTNCHKWFCSPKGCALMYVTPMFQPRVRPLVVSHGFGSGFSSEFIWLGLRDLSPFLALHPVLDFWEGYGTAIVQKHIHQQAAEQARLLADKWKTGFLAPLEMFASMVLVRLPDEACTKPKPHQYSHAEEIQNVLHYRHRIEVPIKVIQGDLYVRISFHIYNQPHEYEKLAVAILSLNHQK
eukprot:m.21507 g.21507  ORF g.21507 m.21507 type:complete len:323 (+) comp12717_c0_seq1:472-1440(+)